jgi:hypothetical protein
MTELLSIFAQADTPQIALLRLSAFVVGALVLVHFACMAFRVVGHTACVLDAVLIAGLAAAGLGVMLDAVFFELLDLLILLTVMSGGLIAFMLRLWVRGFHVSKFLAGRMQHANKQEQNHEL